MVDSGYTTPTDRIIVAGEAPIKTPHNVGVATNMYPGRLVVRENSDYDIKVSDGILPVRGFLGYEDASPLFRPANLTTLYAVDTEAPVIRGGGFTTFIPTGLAAGTVAAQGDLLASWSGGQVVPCKIIDGKVGIKIPFVKKTSEFDTGLDLPAGIIVHDVIAEVTTADNSGTIDVGILSTESGGDADGFLDGESLAATGFRQHNMVDATAANITLGVLLDEVQIKDATATPVFMGIKLEPGYITDGTAKSITYTTSNHTVAGNIYVLVSSPGIRVVGQAGASADASAAAANIFVESVI